MTQSISAMAILRILFMGFVVVKVFAVDSSRTPNGIQVSSDTVTLEVLALRENVVRVRVGRYGKLPEDASWAVLPNSRQSAVSVIAEDSPDETGFSTKSIRVKISRKDLQLSITDLAGNVLQKDVPGWPIAFHDQAFRIYKKMPADEHYFGLGDKIGPLDHRGQAFTLWNTDAYEFQESTDPLYKAIPFFLAARAGRYTGIFFDNTWRSSFDFGKESEDVYSFSASGGPIDYYVMYGPDPKQGPYILMGKVLAKKGESELAVRALRHALSMDPNNSVAHHLLGQAYRDLGQAEEAEKELKIAEQLTNRAAEQP